MEARIVQQRGAARDRYRQQCTIAAATSSNSAASSPTAAASASASAAASAAAATDRRCPPSREVRARYEFDRSHLGAHLQG